jgi:pyruvate/2-oxoglutarate dehydrogenase complex dihydrolipoamide dehydrogenase (E3) component
VTIIEMMDDILLNVNAISKYGLMEGLVDKGVKWSTGLKVDAITDSRIVATDKNWEQHSLEGSAVLALGLMSRNSGLREDLNGKVSEIYSIGDCVVPRRIWNAIHEGFHVANSI